MGRHTMYGQADHIWTGIPYMLDIVPKGLIFLVKLMGDDSFFETLAMYVLLVFFFSHCFEISCFILKLLH